MQEHVWPPNKANKENLCLRIQKELATNIAHQVTFSGTSALTSGFQFFVANTEKLKITANLAFQEILSSLTQVKFALTLVTARSNGVLKWQKQRSRYRTHTHTHTRARALSSQQSKSNLTPITQAMVTQIWCWEMGETMQFLEQIYVTYTEFAASGNRWQILKNNVFYSEASLWH